MTISLESRITGIIAEKDADLRVISCNKVFVELAGVQSEDKVIGLTDDDFCWQKYAALYASHEMDALTGNNYSTVIPSKDHTGREAISLHTKIGKKDNKGNIISVFCRAIEIINPSLNELVGLLVENSPFDKQHYYVGRSNSLPLSRKENEVLFYLSHGKRAKSIATILNRSVRTIEHHIAKTKEKLNCRTAGELIAFAITHGVMQSLPEDTLENLIEKIKTY